MGDQTGGCGRAARRRVGLGCQLWNSCGASRLQSERGRPWCSPQPPSLLWVVCSSPRRSRQGAAQPVAQPAARGWSSRRGAARAAAIGVVLNTVASYLPSEYSVQLSAPL